MAIFADNKNRTGRDQVQRLLDTYYAGDKPMQTVQRVRISKGNLMARLAAALFVGTGLFLGALLAALAGV